MSFQVPPPINSNIVLGGSRRQQQQQTLNETDFAAREARLAKQREEFIRQRKAGKIPAPIYDQSVVPQQSVARMPTTNVEVVYSDPNDWSEEVEADLVGNSGILEMKMRLEQDPDADVYYLIAEDTTIVQERGSDGLLHNVKQTSDERILTVYNGTRYDHQRLAYLLLSFPILYDTLISEIEQNESKQDTTGANLAAVKFVFRETLKDAYERATVKQKTAMLALWQPVLQMLNIDTEDFTTPPTEDVNTEN